MTVGALWLILTLSLAPQATVPTAPISPLASAAGGGPDSVGAFPQEGRGEPTGGRIYWGGSVRVRYGRTSAIGVYPMVGYKITPPWSVGLRAGYEFVWWERFARTLTSHSFAGSAFSRYRIIPQAYLHAEYGAGNYERYSSATESDRVTYPFLFLGGGLSQRVGRNSWFLVEILYEVLQDRNSPYDNGGPVITLGFGVGF
jgi:hypothetical protein